MVLHQAEFHRLRTTQGPANGIGRGSNQSQRSALRRKEGFGRGECRASNPKGMNRRRRFRVPVPRLVRAPRSSTDRPREFRAAKRANGRDQSLRRILLADQAGIGPLVSPEAGARSSIGIGPGSQGVTQTRPPIGWRGKSARNLADAPQAEVRSSIVAQLPSGCFRGLRQLEDSLGDRVPRHRRR